MATTAEIITAAVREAEADPESLPEPEGAEEETSTEGEGTVAEVSPSAGEVESAKEPAKVAEPDELTKELEELGIVAKKKDGKDNWLPYSRTRKIFENAKKKWVEAHASELSERDGKLTTAEQELSNFRKADELFRSDPDRYVQVLAALNPAYRKYLEAKPADAAKPAATVAVEALGPRPVPDVKFEDGSLGYSPQQHEKLLDWVAATAEAKAVARAEESYEKRFGPIEKNWRAQQTRNEQLPRVQAQYAQAKKTWGKLFEDDYNLGDKSEVLKAMRANDGENGRPFLSFEAILSQVFLPKIQTDDNTKRAAWMKELNARPKAAAKAAPAAVKTDADSGEPKSTADVIREAVAAAGLKI